MTEAISLEDVYTGNFTKQAKGKNAFINEK